MNNAVAIMLLVLIGTGAARAADVDTDCEFQPPQAMLQSTAYAGYTFKRAPENNATERAQIRDKLNVEVATSQCADSIVRTITFIVPSAGNMQHDQRHWLDLARTEIAALKRREADVEDTELKQFLTRAAGIAPRAGTRSACKDGSTADAGECTWDSMGGYIFEVKKSGATIRVSVTEYSSA
jgi:hypothetical protein